MTAQLRAADFPPGLVCILHGDLARWTVFEESLDRLQFPPGSDKGRSTGLWVARSINQFLRHAWAPKYHWLMLLADDNPFPPDVLLRLLAHDLPLVAPHVVLRRWPNYPSLFHEEPGSYDLPTPTGFVGYTWAELKQKRGLMPVDTFGGPGCVIKREVIDAMGMPFFQNMPGQLEAPHEDLYTFARCRRAGFQPMVDLSCVIGHCHPGILVPQQDEDGNWGVAFGTADGAWAMLPSTQEAPTNMDDYHAYT